ncbi:MAG: hypothetical protein K2X66_10945, partial [Cyanobacteria bacterium]|nr:hypothetical protein [Cyanobacteriota bacterium]
LLLSAFTTSMGGIYIVAQSIPSSPAPMVQKGGAESQKSIKVGEVNTEVRENYRKELENINGRMAAVSHGYFVGGDEQYEKADREYTRLSKIRDRLEKDFKKFQDAEDAKNKADLGPLKISSAQPVIQQTEPDQSHLRQGQKFDNIMAFTTLMGLHLGLFTLGFMGIRRMNRWIDEQKGTLFLTNNPQDSKRLEGVQKDILKYCLQMATVRQQARELFPEVDQFLTQGDEENSGLNANPSTAVEQDAQALTRFYENQCHLEIVKTGQSKTMDALEYYEKVSERLESAMKNKQFLPEYQHLLQPLEREFLGSGKRKDPHLPQQIQLELKYLASKKIQTQLKLVNAFLYSVQLGGDNAVIISRAEQDPSVNFYKSLIGTYQNQIEQLVALSSTVEKTEN